MKKVNIAEAKAALLSGKLVAIPTETVYGLAAWIMSEEGLKSVFSVKERPFFDPLIVHVDGIESAKKLALEWTEIHDVLARSCWPGPLTIVAKKKDAINPLITSGLDSVGLRCPRHPLTLGLLAEIEGGLAAPSANKFGKTSPTSAEHVYQEFGDDVYILDGGPCDVGIESTVLGIDGQEIKIYRPGHFTAKMLQTILKEHGITAQVLYSESPVAPGQLKHHYMPKIPLVIVPENFNWDQERDKIENVLKRKFSRPVFWKQSQDPCLASRELYEKLRSFDLNGHDLILVSRLPHEYTEEWLGLWNRLEKAKSLEIS